MYIIICEYCSKEFTGRKNQKYCKDECRLEADKERKRTAYRKKHHSNGVDCNHCGKTFTPNKNGAKYKYCSTVCFDDYRRDENRERHRKRNNLYEKYGSDRDCKECGKDINEMVLDAIFCSDDCQNKYNYYNSGKHLRWEVWTAMIAEQRQERLQALEKERAIKSFRRSIGIVIKYKEEEKKIARLTRNCEECGKTFYDPHPNTLTCSTTCGRRRSNRMQRLYMNDRYNEYNLIDKDITLNKLYDRDEGVCHICNEQCDYEDMTITDEGHYIVGKTYPSIDHVIPISKQGKHKWSNVKLAHHYCNTIKRDNLIGNKGMEKTLV